MHCSRWFSAPGWPTRVSRSGRSIPDLRDRIIRVKSGRVKNGRGRNRGRVRAPILANRRNNRPGSNEGNNAASKHLLRAPNALTLVQKTGPAPQIRTPLTAIPIAKA